MASIFCILFALTLFMGLAHADGCGDEIDRPRFDRLRSRIEMAIPEVEREIRAWIAEAPAAALPRELLHAHAAWVGDWADAIGSARWLVAHRQTLDAQLRLAKTYGLAGDYHGALAALDDVFANPEYGAIGQTREAGEYARFLMLTGQTGRLFQFLDERKAERAFLRDRFRTYGFLSLLARGQREDARRYFNDGRERITRFPSLMTLLRRGPQVALRAEVARALREGGEYDWHTVLNILDYCQIAPIEEALPALLEARSYLIFRRKFHFMVANVLRMRGYEEAAGKTIAMIPVVLLYREAKEALAERETEKALALLDQAEEISAANANLQVLRADVLEQARRWPEALSWLQNIQTLQPAHADTFSRQGAILSKLGRAPEAVDAFAEAVRRHPESSSDWRGYATALKAVARDPEAEEALRHATPPAWIHRASVVAIRGRPGRTNGDARDPRVFGPRPSGTSSGAISSRRARRFIVSGARPSRRKNISS